MNLCYCDAVVMFCSVFVSVCITCGAVDPLAVMIGISGESWRHKSTHSWFSRLGMPIILPSTKYRLRYFQILILCVYYNIYV